MLKKCFSAPKTLRRLRGGISGPHIDAFAEDLEREGYAPASAGRYIRAAAHLGCFVQRKGSALKDINLNMRDSFNRHLRRCRCPIFSRGKISYHAQFGVKLFHHHLVGCGICPSESVQPRRGCRPSVAESADKWNAKALRDFLLERASQCGPTTQALITSLRAFLRFLNFRGEFRDDLTLAIPAWPTAGSQSCRALCQRKR
jgi:hypothetical protein